MKTKKQVAVIAAVLMMTLIGRPQETSRLPKKSRLWLEKDVALVITPEETEIFLQLKTEGERERFMEEFWLQRDPNLETRENEFRLAHYRRIALADDKFGRTKAGEGWQTDRGKYYILLGKPTAVESFSAEGILPIEIWSYNVRYIGLPSEFRLLFFQPRGETDYRLFSPLTDGPGALLQSDGSGQLVQPSAITQAHQALGLSPKDSRAWRVLNKELGSLAAETSLSFIPSLMGSEIREKSQALLEVIFALPGKKVDKRYPVQFLSGQADQAVNASLHSTGYDSLVTAIIDPSGLFYIHYALSPESFSLDLSRGNHVTNVKTSLLLTDSEGKTAYQGVRNTEIKLAAQELKQLSDARFQLHDAFPAIPGRYTLNLIMENQAGKEFFSLEKTITIPQSGYPWMSAPILARKMEKNVPGSDIRLAFLAGNHHIIPSLDHIFSPDDKMYTFIQMRGLEKTALDSSVLEINIVQEDRKMMGIQKVLNQYDDIEGIVEEFVLADLPAGMYRLNARLADKSGIELLAKQETFSIAMSPHQNIWPLSLDVPQPSDPRLAFMLGMQYLNRNDREMAYQYLSQAQKGDKGAFEYAMALARVLSTREEWPTMIEVLEPFSRMGRRNFELYVFLGRAFQETGQYSQAVTQYLSAISNRGYITSVLNDLGECYVELGSLERAIWAWEKSLEVRPDQQELKQKLENLKK